MPSSESNKDRKAGAGMAKRKEILITDSMQRQYMI